MKIYYDNADALLTGVNDDLAKYDIGNPNAADPGTGEGILDDYEIQMAGGLDILMQELFGSCLGIAPRGPLGEYDVVGVLGQDCTPNKKVVINKVSSTTPNGREYSGDIIGIPGGEFEMGSADGNHDERTVEGKAVKVTMTGFRLTKTEVTIGQYKAYLAALGDPTYSKLPDYKNNKKGDKFPVVGLNFYEKMAFARYYGGTLPTAAQIEYASKGPSHNETYGTPIDKAIIWENGHITTAEVCGPNDERANGFGICDLAGNVWETTSDAYDPNFYNSMSRVDPANWPSGVLFTYVEFRGGSFHTLRRNVRAVNRGHDGPDGGVDLSGFRVAWPQENIVDM